MNRLKAFTVFGGIFVLLLGIAAHFFYDLSGQSFFIGIFAPVNESTWEHMKLTFFPMLLFSGAARLFFGDMHGAASAGLFGTLLSTGLIPIIFYTYSGVLGYNTAVLNILTFVVCVLIGVITFYFLCRSGKAEKYFPILFISCAMLTLLFFVFTCFPPKMGIFADPTA